MTLSQTPGVHLPLFADDTCVYARDRKEGYVLRKLQRDFTAMETWCDRWNIKINEDKTQYIHFSHRRGPVEVHLKLIGRNTPLCNRCKIRRCNFLQTNYMWTSYRNDPPTRPLKHSSKCTPF